MSRVRETNYEQFVALSENQFRSQCRAARPIQLGISAGLGKNIGRTMSVDWYEAISATKDEARYLYERDK